jgi:hypothetical protein
VIPDGQWDPGSARRLIGALRTGGVEVHRAGAEFGAGDRRFGSGSHVVLMSQPFRAHAKDVLEVQRYPERRQRGSDPIPPYDISGWTLPAQMGVEAVAVASPFEAPLEPVTSVAATGSISGSGSTYLASPRSNDAFALANRVLRAGGTVRRTRAAFPAGGQDFEAGTFVLQGIERAALEPMVRERGLSVIAVHALPGPADPTPPLSAPRIGVYRSWVPSADEGWTRWVLEEFEFPFRSVRDADVRKEGLRKAFDVVVLPDTPARTLIDGHAPGVVPLEFAGGLGLEGALALKQFVEAGGTLVALDSAADLAVDLFGLGVRNVLKGVPRSDYFCPGGLLRLDVETDHPLAWGLPARATVFAENGPAFEEDAPPDEEGEEQPALADTGRPKPTIVARFAEKDVLYSGWLLGDSRIAKKGALVEVPLGKGRVVLVGFRAQFRGQSHGTFKVLFNALFRD